ncbi:hypothetical protein BG011_005467, partial [Mortierella polycephala]
SLTSKSGMRKHLERNKCNMYTEDGEDNEDPEDDSRTLLEPVVVPKTFLSPSVPTKEPSLPKRGYDEAVLTACQCLHASDEEKTKALLILRHFQLKPFTIKDNLGMEQCALTHSTALEKLSVGPSNVSVVAAEPKRRKFSSNVCRNCSPTLAPGLENLMASSPYADVLQARSFQELNDQHCWLLNKDWTFQPNLRYVCARLLAGCILLNTSNGQAVIVNTVEVYGRNRRLDVHRERLIPTKGKAVRTSLPPSTGLRYEDVWPLTVRASDGERLVIGTQSCNFLITSSLRLDGKQPPSLGGSTTLFRLYSESESSATRIFLDEASIKCALALNSDDKAWSVQSQDQVAELRQLRTKFDDSSTFMLCRASGHFARQHACQPYTVFNLATCDRFRSRGKGLAVAIIFNEIAQAVLDKGAAACLKRTVLEDARSQCGGEDGITKAIDNILALFITDTSTVTIIGNTRLNKELEVLADSLTSFLVKANEYSRVFLEQSFVS